MQLCKWAFLQGSKQGQMNKSIIPYSAKTNLAIEFVQTAIPTNLNSVCQSQIYHNLNHRTFLSKMFDFLKQIDQYLSAMHFWPWCKCITAGGSNKNRVDAPLDPTSTSSTFLTENAKSPMKTNNYVDIGKSDMFFWYCEQQYQQIYKTNSDQL